MSAGEMYTAICVESIADRVGLDWRERRLFTFLFPVTLTLDVLILELHHHSLE